MRKEKMIGLLLVLVMMCALVGCGGKKSEEPARESAYGSAVEILNVLWDNSGKEFPAFGGNFENNVDNAPGALNIEDKDTMTAMLLIPEDVQSHVTDAATLFHMMNANTFTGAALKLDGMSADEAAGKIKDAFKGNAFMCGMPDKIVIYTVGSDLTYFFGAEDVVEPFKTAAEQLTGGKLVVEENYQ